MVIEPMRPHRVALITGINIFFTGVAFASMTPYRAIIGIDEIGLSNADFGLIMALNAVGGALISVFLGWLSDRVSDRRIILLLCAFGGMFGFGIAWLVRNPLGFAMAFCLLIPFGNALFSQSFSFARTFLDAFTPTRSELTLSFLRSGFTAAWVLTPPVAGLLAATTHNFVVFAIACSAHLACLLLIIILVTVSDANMKASPDARTDLATEIGIPKPYRLGVLGVTLSMTALHLNISVLPLLIMKDLQGTFTQVGMNAALAAIIEIPMIIGWGYLALWVRKTSILASSSLLFAIYFILTANASNVLQVMMFQVLAAAGISALLSINISYLQEVMPGRVGLSTSLLDVTGVLAAVSAAVIFAANPWPIYANLMLAAGVLCVLGALCLFFTNRMTDE